MSIEQYYSSKEVEQRLKISASTLGRRRKDGSIIGETIGNTRNYRYKASEVERLMRGDKGESD